MFRRRQKVLEIDFSGPPLYPDEAMRLKIQENNAALKRVIELFKMQKMLLKGRLGLKARHVLFGNMGPRASDMAMPQERKEVFDYLRASELAPWWKRTQFNFSTLKAVNTLLAIEDAMLAKGYVPPDPESILMIGRNYLEEFTFRTNGLKECLDVLRGGKMEFSYKFRRACLDRYGYRAD